MSDRRVFAFPNNPTRRERLAFSKNAGMELAELSQFFDDDDPNAVTRFPVEAEAALILIAAQREDSTITFDQVLDNDGWVLGQPEATESESDGPLAPPTGHVSPESTSTPH